MTQILADSMLLSLNLAKTYISQTQQFTGPGRVKVHGADIGD